MNLILSRGAGSDFISPGESSGYNSAASSINGDQSPMQNGKQKRLSIVREEIMDVIDERYNADIDLFLFLNLLSGTEKQLSYSLSGAVWWLAV